MRTPPDEQTWQPDESPKPRAAEPLQRRLVLGGLFVFTCVGLVVGLEAFGPYLGREHRTLTFWEGLLVWFGDATTFLWFCHYFVRHFLLGEPFQPTAESPRGSMLLPVASLAFAWAVDLTVSLGLMYREKKSHASAEEVIGRATAVQKAEFPACTKYDVDCQFTDKQGRNYTCRFTIRDDRQKGWPTGVPQGLVESLRVGQVPFAVAVRYDPDQPGRNWIAGTGWDDGERLHYFSLLPLLFQAMFLPVFLLLLSAEVREKGRWPWWYDFYKIVPLMTEVGVFFVFGIIELELKVRQ